MSSCDQLLDPYCCSSRDLEFGNYLIVSQYNEGYILINIYFIFILFLVRPLKPYHLVGYSLLFLIATVLCLFSTL